MEVPAWPAPNASWSLSWRSANPESPPNWRMVFIRALRPVRILWTYTWWLTSQMILSFGESKSRCRAMDSSTTPRLEARCPPPPMQSTVSTRNWRTSPASSSSCSYVRPRRSRGPSTRSRIWVKPGSLLAGPVGHEPRWTAVRWLTSFEVRQKGTYGRPRCGSRLAWFEGQRRVSLGRGPRPHGGGRGGGGHHDRERRALPGD